MSRAGVGLKPAAGSQGEKQAAHADFGRRTSAYLARMKKVKALNSRAWQESASATGDRVGRQSRDSQTASRQRFEDSQRLKRAFNLYQTIQTRNRLREGLDFFELTQLLATSTEPARDAAVGLRSPQQRPFSSKTAASHRPRQPPSLASQQPGPGPQTHSGPRQDSLDLNPKPSPRQTAGLSSRTPIDFSAKRSHARPESACFPSPSAADGRSRVTKLLCFMPDRKLNHLVFSKATATGSGKPSAETQPGKPLLFFSPGPLLASQPPKPRREKSPSAADASKETHQASLQAQTAQERRNLKGLPFVLKSLCQKPLHKQLKRPLTLRTATLAPGPDPGLLSSRRSARTQLGDSAGLALQSRPASHIDRWETNPSQDDTHFEMHDFEEYVNALQKKKL